MPHLGNYKQIFFTSNTLFTESFDYLNGPYLMLANTVSKDILIEGYETVKVMEYDPEQEAENLSVYKKLAVGVIIGENE